MPNPSNGAGSYRVIADALSKLATDNLSAKVLHCGAAGSGGQAVKRQSLGPSASVASRRGQRWLTVQDPLRLCRIAGHPEFAVIDQRLSQQLGSSGVVTGIVAVEQHPCAQSAQLCFF
jgi:hypothetical protein